MSTDLKKKEKKEKIILKQISLSSGMMHCLEKLWQMCENIEILHL